MTAIQGFIDNHNSDPEPSKRTAGAQEILDKVARARAALDEITSQ